jgi:UDP-hydrolysing UDP-N-acetyl-D-glucosamine 2-epimerase
MEGRSMKRKICVVTGSRADYGHLIWLLREIKNDKDLTLQIAATGSHLSKTHGLTYKLIEKDGFNINAKVPILSEGHSQTHITEAIGRCCIGFAKAFDQLKPDIVVLLGDRFEMLGAAIAAHVAGLPIAHIHGGEATEGAIDEAFRHAITKMSDIHFAAAEPYRRRIIQLGESPKRVFNFGTPGLDALKHMSFLSKDELAKKIGLDLRQTTVIVTFHPATLEQNSLSQIDEFLKALTKFNFNVLFTQSNADPYGQMMFKKIQAFCKKSDRAKVVSTLGYQVYLSCLKHFDLMIGNSSSGLIEGPAFGIPAVNIGDRQRGRVKAASVLDVKAKQKDIEDGIKKALSPSFINQARKAKNPYIQRKPGKASFQIKETLKKFKIGLEFKKKEFQDI